mmetsp:Transcript_3976/g.5528  ORF Transcript_3976/g.5528 Transcript_3976/m.5528 type:complete len:204 (+) Transcript_3976:801-1412(+)
MHGRVVQRGMAVVKGRRVNVSPRLCQQFDTSWVVELCCQVHRGFPQFVSLVETRAPIQQTFEHAGLAKLSRCLNQGLGPHTLKALNREIPYNFHKCVYFAVLCCRVQSRFPMFVEHPQCISPGIQQHGRHVLFAQCTRIMQSGHPSVLFLGVHKIKDRSLSQQIFKLFKITKTIFDDLKQNLLQVDTFISCGCICCFFRFGSI